MTRTDESREQLIAELFEALELADCLLSGCNMNRRVVERKVRAALGKVRSEAPAGRQLPDHASGPAVIERTWSAIENG